MAFIPLVSEPESEELTTLVKDPPSEIVVEAALSFQDMPAAEAFARALKAWMAERTGLPVSDHQLSEGYPYVTILERYYTSGEGMRDTPLG